MGTVRTCYLPQSAQRMPAVRALEVVRQPMTPAARGLGVHTQPPPPPPPGRHAPGCCCRSPRLRCSQTIALYGTPRPDRGFDTGLTTLPISGSHLAAVVVPDPDASVPSSASAKRFIADMNSSRVSYAFAAFHTASQSTPAAPCALHDPAVLPRLLLVLPTPKLNGPVPAAALRGVPYWEPSAAGWMLLRMQRRCGACGEDGTLGQRSGSCCWCGVC